MMLQPKLRNPKHLDDALGDVGNGWYQYVSVLTAILLWSAEGFQVAMFTTLATSSPSRMVVEMASCCYGAQLLALLLGGVCCRECGPRRIAIAAAVMVALGSASTAASPDSRDGSLLGGQGLVGLGLAGAHSACSLAIDWSPPASRPGVRRRCPSVARTAGLVLGYAAAAASHALGYDEDMWRGVAAITALVALVAFCLLVAVLRESPRWMVRSGRRSEADAAVRYLASNYGSPTAFEDVECLSLDPKRRRPDPLKPASSESSLYSSAGHQRVDPATPLLASQQRQQYDIMLIDDNLGNLSLLCQHLKLSLVATCLAFGVSYFASAALALELVRDLPSKALAIAGVELFGLLAFEIAADSQVFVALSYFLVAGFSVCAYAMHRLDEKRGEWFVLLPLGLARGVLGTTSAAEAALPALCLPPVLLSAARNVSRAANSAGFLLAALVASAKFGREDMLNLATVIIASAVAISIVFTTKLPSTDQLRSAQQELLEASVPTRSRHSARRQSRDTESSRFREEEEAGGPEDGVIGYVEPTSEFDIAAASLPSRVEEGTRR